MRDRGVRWAHWLCVAAALGAASVFGGIAGCGGKGDGDHAGDKAAPASYFCPMHPQIVSDRQGDCPICNMRLVPAELPQEEAEAKMREEAAGAGDGQPRRILYYRSPMNPTQTSPVPMKDEMGMDYVPVYSDEVAQGGGGTPQGYSAITINPEKQQLIGLKLSVATRERIDATIRTVGSITPDERRIHHVHTRYEGYIDEVFADFEGKRVRAGEPLASIYSPDVLATQEEYLLAYHAFKEAEAREGGSAPAYTRELLEAARRRLLLWNISPHDIEQIEREGTPIRALSIYAPISGVITARIAFHGMKVMPEDVLFDLVDLSRVWIVADVYEQEVSRVTEGATATITLSHAPGRIWSGRVSYVYPTVEEKTRTVKVRVEAENKDGQLRPGMFADVVLSGEARDAITVPDEAVLDSGVRKVVFVHAGEGRFEPREVTTGTRAGGRYEIVNGVAEGESVASSANFLLDSESRLRAAISAASSPQQNNPPPSEGAHD
jgi:multidrug efflux pump subunit AcrA (membrane-fusion protein)